MLVSSRLLYLSVVLLCAAPATSQEPDSVRLTRAERAAIADTMIRMVEAHFAHWPSVPGLDRDSLYSAFRSAAAGAPTRLAFDTAALRFTAALRNGHTVYSDLWQWRTYGEPLYVATDYRDGRWVIARSLVDGLRSGDVIAAVNGVEVEDFFRERRDLIAASREREARSYFFGRSILLPERMVLTLADGRRVAVERGQQDQIVLGTPVTAGWWIDASVAYIRIPSFGQPHYEARALELLREFRDAAAVIIDVRGNGGGSTPVNLTYALTGPYRWWIIGGPDGEKHGPFILPFTDEQKKDVEGIQHYAGQVVVLIDQDCGSACDDFVMPIQVEGRGTLVGETTAGTSGQPIFYRSPRSILFQVSSRRQYFPDTGAEFEGVGVAPDIEVAPTPEDLRAHRDPVLQKALELVASPDPGNSSGDR